MATIFISHSSRDDALAGQLEAWLIANGFTDLFIDHSHISGGEAWADALRANAGSARVVLCLITPNWLASGECPAEFKAAWYMGKRIIPLFLLGDESALDEKQRSELGRVRAEAQGLDLTPFFAPGGLSFAVDEPRAEVLKRGLREAGALAAVGLDPEAFEIDRALRPSPFPGLASFGDDDADAALFFGRSREIAEVLETLRKMRAAAETNPLVILGASGSGKSSLLKAGIIPRLRREASAWLPLRAFRPGADPLLNFAEAIAKTLADFGEREAHGVLKRTLLEAWQNAEQSAQATESYVSDATNGHKVAVGAGLQKKRPKLSEQLSAIGDRLRTLANRPGATILISVDQAEELARSEGTSGQALTDYLRAAMDGASLFRLAFTIRTDSFPELQAHPRFQRLEARGYDLRTLPVFRFDDVAEDPAARYRVVVDPALTDGLMEDAPGKDALPLLAFALQRQWDQFHVSGKLTHADYASMGGLSGLIEDAAERALCGIEPEQRDTALPAGGAKAHQIELARGVFVPALADVNDEGAAIRRVASWSDFSPQQQELLERFDRWRLVVRKDGATDGNGATVEVAHEALFREWSRLLDWLEPERVRLEALRGLKLATTSWQRHNRQGEFLTHFGDRLGTATALADHPRYGPHLGEGEQAYLTAAAKSEKRLRRQKRRLQAFAGVALVALAAGGTAYLNRAVLGGAMERQVLVTQLSPEKLNDLTHGETFRDCRFDALCPDWMPDMVMLPAGQFMMGSPDDDPETRDNEVPEQKITISRFAVGKFEVTHAEWQACVDRTEAETKITIESYRRSNDVTNWVGCAAADQSGFGGGDRPVINVSWQDAQGYVRWLNHIVAGDPDGGIYRLLTEAEWEYAARGVTTADTPVTRFGWGDDDPVCERGAPNGGVFFDCLNNGTQPVGFSSANAFGLHDMHGNVSEWVDDCYRDKLDDQPEYGHPYTEENCTYRVFRGGGWLSLRSGLRSASRDWGSISDRPYTLGFRVARTLSPPSP